MEAKNSVDPFDPKAYEKQGHEPAIMADDSKSLRAANLQLLVFDMGHVFVDFEWEKVRQGFCDVSGRTHEEVAKIFLEVAKLGYEKGLVDTSAFLAGLNERLGTSITRQQFVTLWNNTFRENQEMAELLQRLKEQRPLYLLSNTNEVHYDFLQSTYNVARHFDELILSYVVGSSKPEAAIYEEVLRRSGYAAHQCLFVDDLRPNIEAASALGMHTIHFTGAADLKQRLRDFGFEV